ncbi:type I restriction-modification system subunit M, partial [Staphylococcus sp. HMSC36A10]
GKETQVYRYFGQERNNTTYNLARMNMLLHDVRYENFDIRNDDTLENPAFLGHTFDAVIANPPYSAKWTADSKFENDERFSGYGKLAPKSKADFAFIQHMVHYLDDEGTMAVVLPHGVLFRGAAEGVIRRYLIEEKNYLEAVIGLPANIFYGTSIPTCILVFKKCRQQEDYVLFIDASNDFEKGKNQNHLTDAQVERIINTYKRKETIDKYSYSATLQEIADNDYNLNIPRYVDTFEEEAPIDLDQVQQDLKNIDKEIAEVEQEINAYLKELGVLKDE